MKTISFLLLLFIGISHAYGQGKKKDNEKGECEYSKNVTDEFTKDRIVETIAYNMFDKKVFKGGWSLTEMIENSYRILFYVAAFSKNGSNSLAFDYEASDGAPSNERSFTFNEVYLMLNDDNIIKIKGEASNYSHNDDYTWFYNAQEYPISDEVWNTLKTSTVKKIRLSYDGSEGRTLEVKEKYNNQIMIAINCIDVLGIPQTGKTEITNKAETKESVKNGNEYSSEGPKPTFDTTNVSIYKQWKTKVMLGKDGIPTRLQGNAYISFNKDGSYTATTIEKDNKKNINKGKFELINDNKIIIFYPESAYLQSSSGLIIKLTNKELEIKGESFDVFYSVY
ncbi:MAG: hypothetical protein IT240_07410 [Bacteroidia bacterium]|nr:hypothetical protein [Bacteroidia bacterium]